MTPDLRLLSVFARGVSLSLHVRVTCLHSGSYLVSDNSLVHPQGAQQFFSRRQVQATGSRPAFAANGSERTRSGKWGLF